MARKIVITSGKGGVGKTTICANLGMRLASLGTKVAMLDIDFGLNNLDVVMGMENKVVYDISDVVEGKCRLKQALIQDVRYPTLFVLPSNRIFMKTRVNTYNIKSIVEQLSDTFDYVLIDCPAGIDNGFHKAVYSASEALVVVTPNNSSIRDADKVLTLLKSYNLTDVNLVINRVRGDLILNGQMIDVQQIKSLLKCSVLGVLPDDDGIATLSCTTAVKSLGADAFITLAHNLHYGKNDIYDYKQKYRGLFGNLKRFIRKKV